MDPLSVSFQLTDSPRMELDGSIKDPKVKDTFMQVSVLGRKLFSYGIECSKDKDQATSVNKQWKEEYDSKWSSGLIELNLFKKYVPLAVGPPGNKDIVYVDVLDLISHFNLSPQQLKKMIASVEGDTPAQSLEKKQLRKLLNINETSELAEKAQAEVVHQLICKLAKEYQETVSTDETRLAKVAMLWNREIPKDAVEGVELSAQYKPFKLAEHINTKAYQKVLAARMELSTSTFLSEKIRVKANLKAADKLISEWVLDPKKETMQPADIQALNWIICSGLKPKGGKPGDFRTSKQEIYSGGRPDYQYILGKDVESEVKLFCEWLNDQIALCKAKRQNPVIVAALACQRLVSIHPFMDGNGRTSCFIMDFILQKFEMPPSAMEEDANVAVFARREDAISTGELIEKVKEGIINSSETFGLDNPFVEVLEH